MSLKSKAEKEREKVAQEKAQTILTAMLRDEDNKYCVDCDSKGPRWASWNLGVFLCIRCAGIHRNLGVHISKVKSVNLDSWTPQQVASMQAMGNSKGRAVYEANLPDDFRRPQTDSAVEAFIRQKYEKKKFIATEWVASKPPDVPVGWEDGSSNVADTKKVEFKKLALPSRAGNGGSTSPVGSKISTTSRSEVVKPSSISQAPLTVSLPPSTSTNSSKPVISNTETDLLGLSLTASGPISAKTQPSQETKLNDDLFGLNSEFSAFVSASPSSTSSSFPTATVQPESQKVDDPSDGKLSKDSILALFGPKSTPAPPIAQPQPNLFGQFASPMGNPQQAPQFMSPNPIQGFNQFSSPNQMQINQQFAASNSQALNPINGTSNNNILGLFNSQPPPTQNVNSFQSNQQPLNNPFMDNNQLTGQFGGLNLGGPGGATSSPSLWQ